MARLDSTEDDSAQGGRKTRNSTDGRSGGNESGSEDGTGSGGGNGNNGPPPGVPPAFPRNITLQPAPVKFNDIVDPFQKPWDLSKDGDQKK